MTTPTRSPRRPADVGRMTGRPAQTWPDLRRPDEPAVRAAHLAPWRDPGSPIFRALVEEYGSARHGVPARPLVIVHTVDAATGEDVPA